MTIKVAETPKLEEPKVVKPPFVPIETKIPEAELEEKLEPQEEGIKPPAVVVGDEANIKEVNPLTDFWARFYTRAFDLFGSIKFKIKRRKRAIIVLFLIGLVWAFPTETSSTIKKTSIVLASIVKSFLGSLTILIEDLRPSSSAAPSMPSATPFIEENITIPIKQPEIITIPVITDVQIEQKIFELINAEREKNNVRKLLLWTRLEPVARNHCKDMLENNFFSHINLKGEDLGGRLKKEAITYRGAGENIFMLQGHERSKVAETAVKGWMQSDGHRKNILSADFSYTAIGVASKDDVFYITQVFLW